MQPDRLIPLAPPQRRVGRCAYYAHFFSPVPRSEENAARIDALIEANWRVLLEDLASQTSAQKAMQSRPSY